MKVLLADPALLQLIWTATVSVLLVIAGILALAVLPWTDRELEQVDATVRDLLTPSPALTPAFQPRSTRR